MFPLQFIRMLKFPPFWILNIIIDVNLEILEIRVSQDFFRIIPEDRR
jgi:hypothetical protein